ncbi:hypothetical protein [Caldimonas sp. KR1-144]|uniref:hypothetical protein n=1 Tax=Caldimonas sp. KR1-144 TaxID=3400911 RepID=UPI003C0ECD15
MQRSQRHLDLPRHEPMRSRPGFLRIEGGCVVTPAGIRIGCAHLQQPPIPSADAEAIQRAFLTPRRRANALLRVLAAGLAAVVIRRKPL